MQIGVITTFLGLAFLASMRLATSTVERLSATAENRVLYVCGFSLAVIVLLLGVGMLYTRRR